MLDPGILPSRNSALHSLHGGEVVGAALGPRAELPEDQSVDALCAGGELVRLSGGVSKIEDLVSFS